MDNGLSAAGTRNGVSEISQDLGSRSPLPPIESYRIKTFAFPRDRVIGDAQIAVDTNWIGAIELIDGDGVAGLGFFLSLFAPLPPVRIVTAEIERGVWQELRGAPPEGMLRRIYRSRGGNLRASPIPQLATAIDQALWDLAAKRAGQPLHRYLGAESDLGPRAYVSGLEFNLADEAVHAFYRSAMARGYDGVKVKVGHADMGWDLARLDLVRDAVGPDPRLMIDANESWTVSDTLRRVEAYAKAGHELHWVEDPILRTDFAGLRELKAALGPVMLNAGEYLDARGKASLVQGSVCDIINLDGHMSEGLHIAWQAAASGTVLALGNSTMNVAAHLGAALPDIGYVEDAMLDTDRILEAPLKVEGGRFVLSSVPGHGLSLAEDAEERLGA
jgi:L-alanine-DL-glutamate epimerase-like enolase superfamily enzyme